MGVPPGDEMAERRRIRDARRECEEYGAFRGAAMREPGCRAHRATRVRALCPMRPCPRRWRRSSLSLVGVVVARDCAVELPERLDDLTALKWRESRGPLLPRSRAPHDLRDRVEVVEPRV